MRGIIVTELKRFLIERYGKQAWRQIIEEAELKKGKMYVDASTYGDYELEAMIGAAIKLTSLKRRELLETFGESLAVGLLTRYKSLIRPDWTAEDVLLNTEYAIHQVIRARHPNADPPSLKIEKVREGEFRLIYYSKRNMLSLAKGITKGVVKHFDRTAVVAEKHHDDHPELRIYLCFDRVPNFLKDRQGDRNHKGVDSPPTDSISSDTSNQVATSQD